MFELPPDLPRLRTLETWHATCLKLIQAAITEAEAKQRQAVRETARAAPPAAGWKTEVQRGAPWRVHHGDCTMGKGRPCTREEARLLLAEGVASCSYCRPDTALGVLG
ncbi:DUF6233 domain-containing protein [Streptomyces sp. 150FB]|uniref:DUF6233 domain-containing protein n=1 Tax=Streptomyces sp. 150FB TaxID=1576605 RepID=UPI0012373875|nr:DUF6233 domain-containing protein [Streptomyces sp. 150FB]